MLEYINSYLQSIVYYMIWLVGIVYAVINRQKHPRTSLFAGMAFGILFLVNLFSIIMSTYFERQYSGGGLPVTDFIRLQGILSLCKFPFSVLAWLLLLVAIFGWKKPAEKGRKNDREDENLLL